MDKIPVIKNIAGSLIFLILSGSIAHASNIDTLKYGTFGKVIIYKPSSAVNSVVLFISGGKGWNKNDEEIGKSLVAQGAIVAGIDCRQYLKRLKTIAQKCFYPAGDLEELSMFIQKKYKLSQYFKPILVGLSSGSTLAYGALAQAPANTFKGVLALAFKPDINLYKPLCVGSGLKQHAAKNSNSTSLEASGNLTAPFVVLYGTKNPDYPQAAMQQYMKNVNTGLLVEMPDVDRGFVVSSAWLPRFIDAYKKILVSPGFAEQKAAQNALLQSQKLKPLGGDFPVITIPAAARDSLPMVYLISGDGGWTSFDNSLGEAFAAKGMPVVGLDAQKYFWNAKTPDETTTAVSKAIQHYMQQWNKKKFVLAGYSFGACVVPFIADRLSTDLKKLCAGVYSLSPDETADFEIHISDMLNFGTADDKYNVPAEIRRIKQLHPVCVFGIEESSATRSHFAETGAKIITVPGNHHYNDNPAVAAGEIVKEINKTPVN